MTILRNKITHFGYQSVPWQEKQKKVSQVFSSVSDKYDLMNDLMSLGVHRLWKNFAVGACGIRSGDQVLDLAGGTGDLTRRILKKIGSSGKVTIADINLSMLQQGYDRLIDSGHFKNIIPVCVNAENLSFSANYFDCIIIGFGLRNVTDQVAALSEMYRVLKPGGCVVVLEFSQPILSLLDQAYDLYSFKILPWLGKVVVNDEASYRYLVESIRKHPNQEKLLSLMEQVGFEDAHYYNLSGGIVAVHKGYKF